MSILEELRAKFQQAQERQHVLATIVKEDQEQVRKRLELEKAIEAEEIAAQIDAKIERFKAIARELPVTVIDFDRAAINLMQSWQSIEPTHQAYKRSFEGLMHKQLPAYHGLKIDGTPVSARERVVEVLSDDGGVIGTRIEEPSRVSQFPAWFPKFEHGYYGKRFGEVLNKAWYKAERGEKNV